MNGTSSGTKAGTTLSGIQEDPSAKMAAPNMERPSVIEDARLYPEVSPARPQAYVLTQHCTASLKLGEIHELMRLWEGQPLQPHAENAKPGGSHQFVKTPKACPFMQTTGKRMGQIVRFEMDDPESAGVQTQQPLPVDHPVVLPDEEEKSSREANAEIRHKAHQALESLMDGNARFRKVP